MAEPGSGEGGAGIVASLRNLAATLVGVLRTRLELLVTELEEERIRLLGLLFWAAGALFLFGVGILLLTVLIVAVFWESPYRILAVITLAGLFLAGGVAMAIGVRNRMRVRPRLFAASIEELKHDRDQLTS